MTIAYFIEKFKLCATCTAVLNYLIILPYISNNVKYYFSNWNDHQTADHSS